MRTVAVVVILSILHQQQFLENLAAPRINAYASSDSEAALRADFGPSDRNALRSLISIPSTTVAVRLRSDDDDVAYTDVEPSAAVVHTPDHATRMVLANGYYVKSHYVGYAAGSRS